MADIVKKDFEITIDKALSKILRVSNRHLSYNPKCEGCVKDRKRIAKALAKSLLKDW